MVHLAPDSYWIISHFSLAATFAKKKEKKRIKLHVCTTLRKEEATSNL